MPLPTQPLSPDTALLCLNHEMTILFYFQLHCKLKIEVAPPDRTKQDWIGPPDPTSNLRPYKFYIPRDETWKERDFRLQRQEIQEWNQDFWAKHNRNFETVNIIFNKLHVVYFFYFFFLVNIIYFYVMWEQDLH